MIKIAAEALGSRLARRREDRAAISRVAPLLVNIHDISIQHQSNLTICSLKLAGGISCRLWRHREVRLRARLRKVNETLAVVKALSATDAAPSQVEPSDVVAYDDIPSNKDPEADKFIQVQIAERRRKFCNDIKEVHQKWKSEAKRCVNARLVYL